MLKCTDCGRLYGESGFIDAIIPNKYWEEISPTGGHGGILCICCMSKRLTEKGYKKVPVILGSGAFKSSKMVVYRITQFIINKIWMRHCSMTCYSLERFKKRIKRYEGFGVEMKSTVDAGNICIIHLYCRNSIKRIKIDVGIINSVEDYLNHLKRLRNEKLD